MNDGYIIICFTCALLSLHLRESQGCHSRRSQYLNSFEPDRSQSTQSWASAIAQFQHADANRHRGHPRVRQAFRPRGVCDDTFSPQWTIFLFISRDHSAPNRTKFPLFWNVFSAIGHSMGQLYRFVDLKIRLIFLVF